MPYETKPDVEYDLGDRFLVDDTVPLLIEGEQQQVEVLYTEIDSISVWKDPVWKEDEGWHATLDVCHHDPAGDCVKIITLDLEDVREADGDWMEPTDKSLGQLIEDRLEREQ